MLKWTNQKVTFREVPDEISLCIEISGCPIKCEGCHSKHLWEDKGKNLTINGLYQLITRNEGITCVCLMGGNSEPNYINYLARVIKASNSFENSPLKVAWYSGNDIIDTCIELEYFDFIKLGNYNKELGGLDNPNTNQRMYRIDKLDNKWELTDITSKFWRNDTNN